MAVSCQQTPAVRWKNGGQRLKLGAHEALEQRRGRLRTMKCGPHVSASTDNLATSIYNVKCENAAVFIHKVRQTTLIKHLNYR
jgi:hypothetical protein